MSVTILSSFTRPRIGALELDATVSQSHTAEVEVTEHPVEQGANVTDHAREKPEGLTLEGLVSNTPIAQPARDALGPHKSGTPGPAETAFEQLLKIKSDRQLVTVVTRLQTYEDMMLTSLTFARNSKVGDALSFSASFKRVRMVSLKTVHMPEQTTIPTKANGKNKKGSKVATVAPAELEVSALKGATNSGGWTTLGSGLRH